MVERLILRVLVEHGPVQQLIGYLFDVLDRPDDDFWLPLVGSGGWTLRRLQLVYDLFLRFIG